MTIAVIPFPVAAAERTRVLVIDDHEMLALAIARFVAGEPDIEVVGQCSSSRQGVQAAGETRPSVAVVSFDMDDQPGDEVVRRIMESSPSTRVIAVSAFNSEEKIRDAVDAVCAGFVLRSRVFDELTMAIRVTTSGETFVSPRLLSALLPSHRPGQGFPGRSLSAREVEILKLMASGLASRQMAERLHLSVNTLRNCIQTIFSKLDAHSRLDAVMIAMRQGLIEPGASRDEGDTSATPHNAIRGHGPTG